MTEAEFGMLYVMCVFWFAMCCPILFVMALVVWVKLREWLE